MPGKIFSENHRVTACETNQLSDINLSSIINLIGISAEDQVNKLGIGLKKVLKSGAGWVVVQHDIDIDQLPKTNEEIKMHTRATTICKYFAYREFWICDKKGNELVHVGTIWVMVDLSARKIVKIKEDLVKAFGVPFTKRINKLRKVPEITESEQTLSKHYQVRFTDIDRNGHVNNADYLEWMIDVLPYTFLKTHTPSKISVKFQDEIHHGEDVGSQVQINKGEDCIETIHRISVDGTPKSIASIRWEEKK